MINLFATVTPETSAAKTIEEIERVSASGGISGIAVVWDASETVLGVLTDGDIRNLFCSRADFSMPVGNFISGKFVYAYDDMPRGEQIQMVLNQFSLSQGSGDPRVSKVVLVDRCLRFRGIVNLMDLYLSEDAKYRKIAIYGLGYVGLTLALTLSEFNGSVVGVDTNPKLLEDLKQAQPPFFENGLEPLLNQCLSRGRITFRLPDEDFEVDTFVIAVGTPIDPDGNIIFDHLEGAAASIAGKLKPGAVVICRSTVPLGVTRRRLVPALEKASGLVAGKDFHVAFAPERTVEGNALKELRSLPQIIGGLTHHCTKAAAKLFELFNTTIVHVESLEAAEMVKLINNTFRDTVFSFANEVSLMCEEHNINAFDLIAAANHGYPRNPIPHPSPGVGGICLVKDPILFESSRTSLSGVGFGSISRKVNQSMPSLVFRKVIRFEELTGKAIKKALVVGIAFKGLPETSDTRFSPALDLAALLKEAGIEVFGFDYVVGPRDIERVGLVPISLEDGIRNCEAVFFMNNHPNHAKFDYFNLLSGTAKSDMPFLFFDGWNQFSSRDIESIDGVHYSTLGYMTLRANV